jgi:alpha-glucuronidase
LLVSQGILEIFTLEDNMEYSNCWLQYRRISNANKSEIVVIHKIEGTIIHNAITELTVAFQALYGRGITLTRTEDQDIACFSVIYLKLDTKQMIGKEGYRVECNNGTCMIMAPSEVGLLYGVFALLRNLQLQEVKDFDKWSFTEEKAPLNPLRMLNHWDNMDGSIERGYSGKSFFFAEETILLNDRITQYARLMASIGINGVVINNVNVKGAATELISERYYKQLDILTEVLGTYGVKLFLSINFAAPIEMGGMNTADPCEEQVRTWWVRKAEEIWSNVPRMGGFLVKADSEGRPGPFTYNRTHAEGANMLADAIRPFDGLVIWRCFVYNCQQDWRDGKTDRARAGYDNFMPLDGMFADNVILQIKNGPMDFQVREPVSPLFGGLQKTNMMLEVQIAQEYTGQQRHVCYLIPWFKEILAFNTYCKSTNSTIADIVSGQAYHNKYCGVAAVSNTGNDYNWTGHELAAANLYGFGRLIFDMELSAETIAEEWIKQTFGYHEKVMENVEKILMLSWHAYEKYTSPLGIGWMVKPNHHYGPDVDGYEYDRWGTYHKADHKGIGLDRTSSGTGFCNQYKEPLASIYANRKTCPEELLLFFHHVDYDYLLTTGKTVLQHIYDTHFEGAAEAEQFLEWWKELQRLLEEDVYQSALDRLIHQKDHAKEWRDVINSYFYRKTGIEDKYHRPIY